MAKIIKANGEIKNISDIDKFNLNFLKGVVGGWIEVVYLDNGDLMVVNEEGKLLGLPINHQATNIVHSMCKYLQHDTIVGDVLVCKSTQID